MAHHLNSAAFTVLLLGCGPRLAPDALDLDFARQRYVHALPGAHWDSTDTPHFRLFTEKGTYAAQHLASMRDRVERAWTDDLAMLGMRGYDHRIAVYYFESKARMDSVFDVPGDGQAYPEAQLVLLLANAQGYETPDDRHEIMHVISITKWGWGAEDRRWKLEGLANLASAPDWPYTIDQMAAQARRDGDQRGPADLRGDRFSGGDSVAHFRAYMLVSSFVGFLLRNNGGVERFHTLWEQGMSEEELADWTARWNAYLRTVSLPSGGIDLIHVQACACR